MTKNRSFHAMAASAGLAVALLVGAGAAQARSDVNWAVGIAAPGVAVGVGNGYPAVVAPAPVYYAPPPPVYYAPPPRPVYYAPPQPVYYAPPAYVAPPPGYYYRDGGRHHRHRGHGHGHGYGHRDDRGGRGDRWDRR